MIRLGPSGSGLSTPEGIDILTAEKLSAMEVPFTYQVWMKKPDAIEFGKKAKKFNIFLSVHASYFINLNSTEKHKIEASKKRILASCERAEDMQAKYVVFHAGFYGKDDSELTYQNIKKQIIELQDIIKKQGWKVMLAPETTGKKTQFGDLDELIRLKKETGCHLCVDFAHILAREGKIDYDDVMKKLKPLKHIHAHFSGINYGPKGERNHELTEAKDIKLLLKKLKQYNIDITIINESPDPLNDTIKSRNILNKLK